MVRFKTNTLLIHLTCWFLFLIFPVLFLSRGNKDLGTLVLLSSPFYWLFCLTYLLLFYINFWYLVPSFFLKRKYLYYAGGVAALLFFVYFLQPFDKLLAHNPRVQAEIAAAAKQDSIRNAKAIDTLSGPSTTLPFGPLPHQDLRMKDPVAKPSNIPVILQHSQEFDIVSVVLFLIVTVLSLSVRTVAKWQSTEQKVVKAEAERATAELSFLKAQINPHFLFNTLNNLYTLSITNSEKTSESIMKLSNIMRYVTDDVTNDLVLLRDDLNCIQDYIDLQKLRLGKKTKVDFQVTGTAFNQKIAPLILMSFVENIFKYGISKHEESTVKIRIAIDGEEIGFYSENSIFEKKSSLPERTGIGIANTKQRLEHLYPNRHVLTIDDSDGLFRVKLILK